MKFCNLSLILWEQVSYVGLLRPTFSAQLSPNELTIDDSHSMTYLFLSICHPKPALNYSILTANWLFQMILCAIFPFKVRNSILSASTDGMAVTKRPNITFSPNAPIILGKMQSLTNDPIFFAIFLSPNAPGCKKLVPYTNIDFIYEYHQGQFPAQKV